jgi:hypothetical protein
MNAEDVDVGMELEAESPGGFLWHPVKVIRRLGVEGRFHGLFEVRAVEHDGPAGTWIRYAREMRRSASAPAQVVRIVTADGDHPSWAATRGYFAAGGTATPHFRPRLAEGQAVSRVAAAAGGLIAVWSVGNAAVAVEVEVLLPRRSRSGPPQAGEIRPVVSQGILVPTGDALRMARSLRAGSAFYFAAPGAAIWTAPSHPDFEAATWPDDGQPVDAGGREAGGRSARRGEGEDRRQPEEGVRLWTVVVGRRAAALLAGLVESAAGPRIFSGLSPEQTLKTTAASPDMKSAAEEAVAAACEVVERRRTSVNWNSGADRTKIAMELAGRLLQWDAARMALEAARLRGKAPGASLATGARPAGDGNPM